MNTVKVRCETDEWYPVYILNKDNRSKTEIPTELYDRYVKAIYEFNTVQLEIEGKLVNV